MKNLIYSFIIAVLSGFFLFSCSSARTVSSGDFSKRKYTTGRLASLKNHFSNSFIYNNKKHVNNENLISQANENRLTHIYYQAAIEQKDKNQKNTIKQVIKELVQDENNSLYLAKETPNNQCNELPKTSLTSQNYFEFDLTEDQLFKKITHRKLKAEPMARLSLMFAILGYLPICLFPFLMFNFPTFLIIVPVLCWIAAVVLGLLSLNRNPREYVGKDKALSGILLAIAGIFAFLFAFLL